MNDLERILVAHSDMDLRIVTTELGWFEVVLKNDGGLVALAVGETIEGALTSLEPRAVRAFALEADVWPG